MFSFVIHNGQPRLVQRLTELGCMRIQSGEETQPTTLHFFSTKTWTPFSRRKKFEIRTLHREISGKEVLEIRTLQREISGKEVS